MGAYEGAGITVVGRGVRVPACNNPVFRPIPGPLGRECHGGAGTFTDGSVYVSQRSAIAP